MPLPPNGTSNTIFRPIPVGISKIEYFRVYNRNGMLVFTHKSDRQWLQRRYIQGKPQDSGGYVWTVQGTDYTGKTVIKKGTVVLIR